ncbi:MAG: phosphate signaling complex protein PhoU, partial [Betaproteobacteria bacterium]|nr:phosphate signaling complex protein PhoU [Betaproteobacteria bacterium]MCH9842347.1 phosphate signaling complex protein PhoU [Betaproteobacteria bacterium]
MASEHIYKQYDADLQSIRAKVLEMGTIVEEQLSEAVQSLVDADTKLAEKVIRRDEEVNDLEIDIDEDCSLLIGKRSPVAADLRNVLMMIKIIGDLERIGDESTKIANATIRIIENDIMSKPQFKNINSMLGSVQLMLRQALNSFARLDTTETIEVLEK